MFSQRQRRKNFIGAIHEPDATPEIKANVSAAMRLMDIAIESLSHANQARHRSDIADRGSRV